MRIRKRDSSVLNTFTNRTPLPTDINRRHAAIQAKSRVMIKPAYLGSVTKDVTCSRLALSRRSEESCGSTATERRAYSKFFVSFESFVVNFSRLRSCLLNEKL